MKAKVKSTKAPRAKQSSGTGAGMGADTFRRIALSLEGAVEMEHMDHPDFRVNGRIFATLAYPSDGSGMVKLTPEQQAEFMSAEPGAFEPCSGAWGRQGCTNVNLGSVTERTLRRALETAWKLRGQDRKETKRVKPKAGGIVRVMGSEK
jgi:hypothetical protein